ncbi:hypothetical protein [Massilibacteroides sp.]|uniref:hypothetical protein n=1 Tax=Massilibacteroides sp. TaxID=2034766 RepID=UPI002613A1C3|nr:hypothetical protein [Massilibacteroides sp.]MDD4514245.1 hypothetical protein [Massilibacteroides sp.]
MKKVLFFFAVGLVFLSTGCKEKTILGDVDLQKNSYTPTTLSSFLGNHRVVKLKRDSALLISAFPRVIKRQNFFYIPTSEFCVVYDMDGNLVRKITYPNPLENENSWVTGYDICMINGTPELWIASGFKEQKLFRFSLEDGQGRGVIKTEYPFFDFRVIEEDKILLVLANNHYLMGVSDFNGKINTVGLKKRDKDSFDSNVFLSYDENYYVQYSHTTLVGCYDKKTNQIKEKLLIEDNPYTSTLEKLTELIKKQGARKGTQSASNSYYCITNIAKKGNVELLGFSYKEKEFLSIRRNNKKFNTMETIPNKHNYLTNDIYPQKNDFLQLSHSADGRTDSDSSILLYLLDDRSDPVNRKEREMVIIEILE